MNLKDHMGKGIWALLDKSFSGIYGFALVILVVGTLPRTEYGIYLIAFSLTNIALIFNKGFILLPMTKYEAEGKPRPRMLGNIFLCSLACQVFFGVLLTLLAPLLARLFHAPGLTELLRVIILVLLGFFFRDFSVAFLTAHRRIKALALIDAVYFIGAALGFLALNLMGVFNRAIMPVYVHIVFSWASSFVALFPVLKTIKFDFRPSMREIRRIFSFGRYSLSMGLGEIVFYQVDVQLLSYFFNPATAAVYNAGKLLFRLYSLITQSLNLLIFPGTSKLHAQSRLEDIKSLYEKVIAYYWTLMLVLNLVLFLGADVLLNIIYGGRYPDSAPIFRLFLLFSFIEPLYNISANVLYGLGRPDKAFRPLIAGVPLFLIANWILIPQYQGIGAALSFNFTNLFMVVFFVKSLKTEVNISLVESFKYMRRIPKIALQLARELSGNRGRWKI